MSFLKLTVGCLLLSLVVGVVYSVAYEAPASEKRVMIPADEVVWEPHGPAEWGLKTRMLWGDREEETPSYGMLLFMPVGFVTPVLEHPRDEVVVIIQGVLRHTFVDEKMQSQDLPPVSLIFQPNSVKQKNECVGPDDCIILLKRDLPELSSP